MNVLTAHTMNVTQKPRVIIPLAHSYARVTVDMLEMERIVLVGK